MQNSKKEIFIIALKLLVICTIVAGIVALVHTITKDKIDYNTKISTAEALTNIYSTDFDGKSFSVTETDYAIKDGGNIIARCSAVTDYTYQNNDVKAIYILKDGQDNPTGYCVSIEPMGFKDVIKMLVAINDDLTVKDVKIISMSDTSGIGTKAQDEGFLSNFRGLSGEGAGNVAVISGATKTSKPVINAVSDAVKEVEVYKNTKGGTAK